MLDAQTKQRINSARDILVGKVPDPKAQVEQITFALIYKFMHDMDLEAEELGGERKFFCGKFEQYAWSNLLSPILSGDEVRRLYSQALETMENNRDIPALFRDVFKNASLPYRDPQTLKSFLKIINEFEYDHSERLGDAFEYLLSVLGSQGDAGQFRTPRHIIDFIVEVVDPQKSESIMDPACGTAGFLISAYKHILKSNSKNGKDGASLTPDERIALTDNVTGYDISPDMVRLSLVNLYLHGFTNPHISEYDTLTSDDKWNEYFDVILANPPFMSPKGGIRPHNRFSIQAKRSEVLFVDYIAEHLNPKGRAGIIVPEGIIFQSQNAYKQLREMLVNDYLYAVVSLPAGVFQPYSGVKTSILILDREKAKQNDSILFVKIDNDGFDLGAQRRAIDINDLPQALQILQTGKVENTDIAHWVEKSKIAENGDWNLSGERYLENDELLIGNYELHKLKDISTIKKGSTITKKTVVDGSIPVIAGGQKPAYYHNESNREGRVITVSSSGAYAGFINFFNHPIFASDCTTIQTNEEEVSTIFLYRLLKSMQDNFYKLQQGGAQPHVYGKDFGEIKIPLPPLSIQEEIVKEIEGYQKIIDGARQVVNNYKPQIKINRDWKIIKLLEVGKIRMCKRIFKNQTSNNGDIPFYKIGTFGKQPNAYINLEVYEEYKRKFSHPKKGDILISTSGTIGRTVVFDGKPAYFQDSNIVWIDNNEKLVTNEYLHLIYQTINWTTTKGGTIERLYNKLIENTEVLLPPLVIQQEIISQVGAEQAMVDANKNLIEIFEQKIKDKISEVWGESD